MITKRNLLGDLRATEEEIKRLRVINNRQKELLDYLKRTNLILFNFAQEVNHQFDINMILSNTRKIIRDHFSNNAYVFLDDNYFPESDMEYKEWVSIEEAKHIHELKELMEMQKAIFIPNTSNPDNYLGEHRKGLQNNTNYGFQFVYKKWFDLTFKEKFKEGGLFDFFIRDCKSRACTKEEWKDLMIKVIRDVDSKRVFCHKNNINSFAAIPLVKEDKTIGYFHLSTDYGTKPLIEEQIHLLTTLANLSVIAIINAERYHQDVYIDNRTGLARRKLLIKYLDEAIKKGIDFSLMVTDLDSFKQ